MVERGRWKGNCGVRKCQGEFCGVGGRVVGIVEGICEVKSRIGKAAAVWNSQTTMVSVVSLPFSVYQPRTKKAETRDSSAIVFVAEGCTAKTSNESQL